VLSGACGAGLHGFTPPQAKANQSMISRASCIRILPMRLAHEGYGMRKVLPHGYTGRVSRLPFGEHFVAAARLFLIEKRSCNGIFGTWSSAG